MSEEEKIINENFVAVAFPDVVGAVATTTSSAAKTAQATAAQAVNIGQKVKEFVSQKQQWIAEKLERGRHHLQNYGQRAFQFTQTLKTVSLFFPIIVVARMIIGFFQKPLEFIMLGVACLVLSVLYVLHFIFSIPPFDWIPFGIYFAIWKLAPLAAYVLLIGSLFAIITLICLIIAGINHLTGGSLKKLVLCQNSPAAWYKTPNFHLQNGYERGFMCKRPCKTGYAPDPDTRTSCVRLPAEQPSYCPQASIMRKYMNESIFNENGYPDYKDMGGWKNAYLSSEEREDIIKEHYMKKQKYLQTCSKAFTGPLETVPLSVCTAKDSKDPRASLVSNSNCSQAFCNTEKAYPFCTESDFNDEQQKHSVWWKRLLHSFFWMCIVAIIVIIMKKEI